MALAVIAAGLLYWSLPEGVRLFPAMQVLYPVFLVLLLAVLVVGDPGRIDRDRRWLRMVTTVLVSTITLASAGAAIRLAAGILEGGDMGGATALLGAGAVVWVNVVLAFALWYWHLDSDGPAARANGTSASLPAFRFPEQDIDAPQYADWYPQFIDYLALSFNTGTAFGPTDVAAVRHWSKLWLMAESAISLALIGLVVASAINEL